MTRSRLVAIAFGLLIPAALYGWLNHARNDLLFATRSIIGQVRKGGEEVEIGLFTQRRFPDGDPEAQDSLFGSIVHAMRADEPAAVEYGESGQLEAVGGARVPWRDVVITGQEGGRYTLQWVKHRGNWYIYDFRE